MKKNPFFLNYGFDKGKLKPLISWFFRAYGESETFEFLEKVKNLGFKHATQSGSSISLDDLATPPTKILLLSAAELQIKNIENQYKRGLITALEKFQQTIDIWQEMNETIKEEVIQHFSSTNILNPVYMMAFSGARGNISQVRQLVGMRGLMADPQGQLIDFPIRSNFREGLTLTEYVISCYGARKGLVDTALRTAKSGYLTRRLVDVSQHITISSWDCGTHRGIFLTNLEDDKSKKVISSLEERLLGRVLHEIVKKNGTRNKNEILFQNEQISLPLAAFLVKEKKQVLVRSALTCHYTQSVCQLCYGWGLSSSHLVSLGEAVGVISGQSIGEPGTQLTMRTFHTGGVFYGELIELLRATHPGRIHFLKPLPGSMIRTPKGKIAFLTKAPGKLCLQPLINNDQTTIFSLPSATLIFVKEGEKVIKGQPLAEFSKKDFQTNAEEEDFINSEMEGTIFTQQGSGRSIYEIKKIKPKKKEKKKNKLDFFENFQLSTLKEQAGVSPKYLSFWILFGKIFQHTYFLSHYLLNFGDLVDTSTMVGSFINFTPHLNQNFEVIRNLKKMNFSIHENLQTPLQPSFLKSFKKQTISSFTQKTFEIHYDVFQMLKKTILWSREKKISKTKYQENLQNFHVSKKKKNFFFQRGEKKREIKMCFETSSEKITSKNYTFDLILQNNIFTICFQDIQYYKFGYFFTFNVRNKNTKILLKNSLSQKFFFSSDFLKFLFLQLVEQGTQTKTSGLIWSHQLYIKTPESKGYLFFFSEDWSFPNTQFENVQTLSNLKKQKSKNFQKISKNCEQKKIVSFCLKTKISRQGEFYSFPSTRNDLIHNSNFKKKDEFFSTLIFRNTRTSKKKSKKKKNNILSVFLTNPNHQTQIPRKFFFLPSTLEKFLHLSKGKIKNHFKKKSTTIRFYNFKKILFMQNFVFERSHQIFFEKKSLNFKKPIPQSQLFLIIKYLFDRLHFFQKNKKKKFNKTKQNLFRINTISVPIKQKKSLKHENIEFFEIFYKPFSFTRSTSFYPFSLQMYFFYNNLYSFLRKNDQLVKKKKLINTQTLQKKLKRVTKLTSLTNFFGWYKGFSTFPKKKFYEENTKFLNNFYSPETQVKVNNLKHSGIKWSRSGFLAGNIIANPLFLKIEPLSFDSVKLVPPFSKNLVFNEIQNQLFQCISSNTLSFLLFFLQENFEKKISLQKKKTTLTHQNRTESFHKSFLQVYFQNQEQFQNKKNLLFSNLRFKTFEQKKSREKKGFFPFYLPPHKKKTIKTDRLIFQKYTCIAQKKEKLQGVFFSQKQKNISFRFFIKSFWTSNLHASSFFQTLSKLSNFEIFLHIPEQKNKQTKNVKFLQLNQKKLEIWLYNDVFLQKVPRFQQIKKNSLFKERLTQPWYHFFSFLDIQSAHFLSFSKLLSFQLLQDLTRTQKTKKFFLYSCFWVEKQLVLAIKHIKKKNTSLYTKANRNIFFDTFFLQNKLHKDKNLVYQSNKTDLSFQYFSKKRDLYLHFLYLNSLIELPSEKKTVVNYSVKKKTQCSDNFLKPLEKKKRFPFLKKQTHKANKKKKVVPTQNCFVTSYLPFFFQNQKKVKKVFPSFFQSKTGSFYQRRIASGWMFFPKHQNQIIQNHKRFLRYGRKGINNVVFDNHLTLMEALPFKTSNYIVSQRPKNQNSPILSFFIKTGVFVTLASLNGQFIQNSTNIDFHLYKNLKENFTSFSKLEKKKICLTKSFLVKLRQTLFRHGQTMKNLAWENSSSSYANPTESLRFQFISPSTFRWNSNFQTQTKKKSLVGSNSLLQSSSVFSSEMEKKCTLHLSRINVTPSLNSIWCLFDSLKSENRNWISRNHIFWFLGIFSKSSHIILFRKPLEFSLENLNLVQTNLSSFLQNTRTSGPKQYVSMVEQQAKPKHLTRLLIKPTKKILQAKKNKQKKLAISQFGQQLKTITSIPFYKPLSIEVRVTKIVSYKKNFKKDSKNDCTSHHTKKKSIFGLFAILLIPKGFVLETSCFLCQLDFGILRKNERTKNQIQLLNKKKFLFSNLRFNSQHFKQKEPFLSWTKKKKKQTLFSIQKIFLQSQYNKKTIFLANVKAKNKNFFDYSSTTTTRIRQFAALPFFKAVTYQGFHQFRKKAPKTALVDFFSTKIEPFLVTSSFTPFVGEIFSSNEHSKDFITLFYNEKKSDKKKRNTQPFLMLTEAEQLTLLLQTKSSDVKLGDLVLNGQKVTQGSGFKEGGQIIEIDVEKIVLRRGQNFVNYSQSSLFITPEETISQGWPIMTFSYQRSKTEDIVQGIPKIDQFFESRSLTEKNFLSLEIEKIDEENKKKYPNEQAVLKSYERIQLMVVESIQRIYLSQGVAISDKHIEIVVKQMTSAVFMYDENDDAGQYFPFLSNFSQIVREAKSLGPIIERTEARKIFFKRVFKNCNFVERQKTLNERKTIQNTIIELTKSIPKKTHYEVQIKKEVIFAGFKICVLRSISHIHSLFPKISSSSKKNQLSFHCNAKSKIFFFTIPEQKKFFVQQSMNPILNKALLREQLQNLRYFNKIRSYGKTRYYKVLSNFQSSFIKNGTKTEKLVLKTGPLFPIYGTTKTKIIAKSHLTFFYNKKTPFKNRLRYILSKPKSLESEVFSNKKTFFKIPQSNSKKPKWVYLPVLIGITQAALTSTSFLSAASFQQTTLVLSRSSAIGRVDFLRGIKERVIFGERLFAGTGHPLSSLLPISLSREIKIFFPKLKKRKSKDLRDFTTNKNFFVTSQNTRGSTNQKRRSRVPAFLVNCCNFRKIKLQPTVQPLLGTRAKNEVFSTGIRGLEKKQTKETSKDNKKISQIFLKRISSQKIFNPVLENWLQNFNKQSKNPILKN